MPRKGIEIGKGGEIISPTINYSSGKRKRLKCPFLRKSENSPEKESKNSVRFSRLFRRTPKSIKTQPTERLHVLRYIIS